MSIPPAHAWRILSFAAESQASWIVPIAPMAALVTRKFSNGF